MKTNKHLIASVAVFAISVLTFAGTVCAKVQTPVWNPAVGTCVNGALVWYCQDTELLTDGNCFTGTSTKQCNNPPANKIKHIYQATHGGACNSTTNPCVDVTPTPPEYIGYYNANQSQEDCNMPG